jgi:hypothetical protein
MPTWKHRHRTGTDQLRILLRELSQRQLLHRCGSLRRYRVHPPTRRGGVVRLVHDRTASPRLDALEDVVIHERLGGDGEDGVAVLLSGKGHHRRLRIRRLRLHHLADHLRLPMSFRYGF